MSNKTGGNGEMKKEYRIERNMCLHYASMYYAAVKDDFVSAAKKITKERYSIVLDPQLEMLLKAAYEIGFADAMILGINRDDHDESYGEEPTCKPRATTAR